MPQINPGTLTLQQIPPIFRVEMCLLQLRCLLPSSASTLRGLRLLPPITYNADCGYINLSGARGTNILPIVAPAIPAYLQFNPGYIYAPATNYSMTITYTMTNP